MSSLSACSSLVRQEGSIQGIRHFRWLQQQETFIGGRGPAPSCFLEGLPINVPCLPSWVPSQRPSRPTSSSGFNIDSSRLITRCVRVCFRDRHALSFSVCFLVSSSSLFFSPPCFPWWRVPFFCYFALALHLPRAPPCEPEQCVFPLRAVSFLALLLLTYYFLFFLLFLPFFHVDLDIFFPSCRLLVGNMPAPRFRFLLRLVQNYIYTKYISRHVRTLISSAFFRLRYTTCFSYCCVYILSSVFTCFSS